MVVLRSSSSIIPNPSPSTELEKNVCCIMARRVRKKQQLSSVSVSVATVCADADVAAATLEAVLPGTGGGALHFVSINTLFVINQHFIL
jgi:hypothetical protein